MIFSGSIDQVDDVVDASVVHGLCGLWGMLATGLFTTKVGYARAYNEVWDGMGWDGMG